MIMLYIYIGLTILFSIISFFMIRKEPRQIYIGFLLELAIYYLIVTIVCVIYPMSIGPTFVMIFFTILLFSIIFTGLFLLVDGFYVIKKEGVSLAHIQPIFWSVVTFFGAYAWYTNCFGGLSGKEEEVLFYTFMMYIVLLVPLAIGGFFVYSFVYTHLKKPYPCDYIITLGCGIRKDGTVTPLLKSRLDKALSWYHDTNDHGMFIVSGGKGNDEVNSEAEAMKNYLVSQGISEDKILLENQSTTTKENLLFSKKLMKENSTCVVSTSDFHVLRTAFLTKEIGLNAYCIGGKTAMYYVPPATLREYIALLLRHKQLILFYFIFVILKTFLNF